MDCDQCEYKNPAWWTFDSEYKESDLCLLCEYYKNSNWIVPSNEQLTAEQLILKIKKG